MNKFFSIHDSLIEIDFRQHINIVQRCF